MEVMREMKRQRPAPTFDVVQWLNHWTIEDNWYIRDAWVRLPDGTVDLYGIPDGRVGDSL
jgi:hypothetical protein